MAKFTVVKCGDETNPSFWGFVFDNRQAAVLFYAWTWYGKPAYRKITNTYEGVTRLVDCRGCSNPGLGCNACVKPAEFFDKEDI